MQMLKSSFFTPFVGGFLLGAAMLVAYHPASAGHRVAQIASDVHLVG